MFFDSEVEIYYDLLKNEINNTPPPPSHVPKNKAIQLYINMTHEGEVNTNKGEYRWRWIQTIGEYMNTNDCEYNTTKPFERTVLSVDLLDSGLVQLKEEK